MTAVKITVFRYHLRFDPEAELQSLFVYFPGQLSQRTSKFLLVHIPVAQPAVIVISLSEPAIIQHDHFYPKLSSLISKLKDCFSCKIEICRFPAVNEYRSYLIPIFSPAQVMPEASVIIVGKFFQSFCRISEHCLRDNKSFPFFQGIAEGSALHSHDSSCLVKLIFLSLCLKSPTVHKHHSITASGFFCGIFLRKDHCRVVLMTGCSTSASDHLCSVGYRNPLKIPFHGMSSIEADHIIISIEEIQNCRSRLSDIYFLRSGIFDPDAPCNNIVFRKDTVKQHCLHLSYRILQINFQSLCLLWCRINCRETGKSIFPIHNFVSFISKIAAVCPVLILDYQSTASVITVSHTRVLLGQRIHRISPVKSGIVGITGKSAVCKSQKIIHLSLYLLSIIQMDQKSIAVHLKLISCLFCVKCKYFLLFLKDNCHLVVLLLSFINFGR